MNNDLAVQFGAHGLATAVGIISSGMVCDIFENSANFISALVTTSNAFCEVRMYRTPMDDGLFWVEVDPYGVQAYVSFEDWGFPASLFTSKITDDQTLTMVVEAIVLLGSVMGRTRDQLIGTYVEAEL